jgi:alditol oxidase
MGGPVRNWAGNVAYSARSIARPGSLDELRRLVAGSDRVRALGTRHSFNRIADSPGVLVSVAGLPPAVAVAADRGSVSVPAGLRYGELAGHLRGHGLALPNLGSLPHISVGGACATGTHGSGDRNGCLSTAVSALELVTADGDLLTLRRSVDEEFAGAVVGLGRLGVVVRLMLDVVPAFGVRQYVYDGLPRDRLAEHFDEVFGSAYSVSIFTDWRSPRINQVWRKQLADAPEPERDWLDARLADGPRHPVAGISPVTCTEQLGVPGPWDERLPHFRLDFTPSVGAELQSEFLLPRDRAVEALAALDQVAHLISPVLLISEIRTVAADDLWLSPAYRRDTVGLHFTWVPDAAAVTPVIRAVEEALAPFEPRSHWGKLFGDRVVLPGSYDRLPDFRRLVDRCDPTGKFRNDLTDHVLQPS